MTKPKTKTILCIWELGEDFGHINRLSKLCRQLNDSDYQIFVALKDLSQASPHFSDRIRLIQAPVWLPTIKLNRPIACLADVLLLNGYLEERSLEGLLRAWSNLVEQINPDLIVYDYAPTALLATKSMTLPKIRIGNGFADVEPGHTQADWRPDPPDNELVSAQEKLTQRTINNVLNKLGEAPIQGLNDYFSCNLTVIDTFPELDIYRDKRANTTYAIGLSSNNSYPKVHFNHPQKYKIVAYLKPSSQYFQQLVESLKTLQAECHIICLNVRQDYVKKTESEDFKLHTSAINLTDAIQHADLFVGHGNTISLTESLLLGTPIAALPIHLEQLVFATRTEELGLGKTITKVGSANIIADQILQALNNPKLRKNIQSFVEKSKIVRESPESIIAKTIKQQLSE